MMPILLGTWPVDDLRRAFVEGAAWWELHQTGATMWASDRSDAEVAAEKRYPGGKPQPDDRLLLDLEKEGDGHGARLALARVRARK